MRNKLKENRVFMDMKSSLNFLLQALLLLFAMASMGQNLALQNGQWFNGTSFGKEIWYVQEGRLTKSRPSKIDQIIDLENGYVVPPFGEAHNHNVCSMSSEKFIALRNQYLRAGIFYVKNPNSLREDKSGLIVNRWINHPHSIDAVFGAGGLTATQGHPSLFFKDIQKGEGNFYHFINSEEDLDQKWDLVLNNKPDFIKIYLLFSEEYALRNGNPEYIGNSGLNPELIALIVKRAHDAGLRVTAHVETAFDFHVVVASGVDEIAHMPGFRGDPKLGIKMPPQFEQRFSIAKEDALLAAKNKTVIITTLGDFVTIPSMFELRRKGDTLHKKNLALLKSAGARLALGSDAYEKNSFIEIDYLKNTGIFSNLELVTMFCSNTPRSIFPDRAIGEFKEGYEASFLVLRGNPLKDLRHLKNISHWIKQGVMLDSLWRK